MSKKAKITRLECVTPNWIRVVNAARRTWGKKPMTKEPSDKFKKKILLAEHSPIRLLEYDFTWEDIRQWVTTHIVRHHEGCEKFVHTQRTDINEQLKGLDRDSFPQGLLNDMDNENAKGCYFNGNYFCTLNLKDESGNLFQALLRYDLTRGTFTLSKNLGVIDYAVLEGENQFKLLLICDDNSDIGELSNKSEYYGATLEKSWHSGESDFGIKKEKRLTKLYLNTQTPVKVRVKCENGYRNLYFDGSEKRQVLPVGLRGQYFSFCIECSNNTCLVSYLCAEFEYEG